VAVTACGSSAGEAVSLRAQVDWEPLSAYGAAPLASVDDDRLGLLLGGGPLVLEGDDWVELPEGAVADGDMTTSPTVMALTRSRTSSTVPACGVSARH
jgi:hypothetical protein